MKPAEKHALECSRAIAEAMTVMAGCMFSTHAQRATLALRCVEGMIPVIEALKESLTTMAKQEEGNEETHH